MSGHHSPGGTPGHHGHDHHHDGGHAHSRPIFRPQLHRRLRSRRAFLGHVGKGTLAAAVLTPAVLAACSSDGSISLPGAATAVPGTEDSPVATEAAAEPTAVSGEPTVAPLNPTAAPADPTATAAEPTAAPVAQALMWARTNLGFVSAYVLARGNTAAIVDTGVPGSSVAIGETLAGLGLNYSDVAHVILTHNHQDHAGAISEVLAEAINATSYAGEADLAGISGSITGLVGGEDIFGFEMVSTPGHTAGHMAAIDHQAGLLLAGDAIFTEGGGVVEGPPQFFSDIPQSRESIKALAALTFNTLLVGHGEPIEVGADTAVAALAASL